MFGYMGKLMPVGICASVMRCCSDLLVYRGSHYYRYYRRRTPKIDMCLVIVVTVLVVSAIQVCVYVHACVCGKLIFSCFCTFVFGIFATDEDSEVEMFCHYHSYYILLLRLVVFPI